MKLENDVNKSASNRVAEDSLIKAWEESKKTTDIGHLYPPNSLIREFSIKSSKIVSSYEKLTKFSIDEEAIDVVQRVGRIQRHRPNLPPKFAEFLLYVFLKKNDREAILGDLAEDFNVVQSKFGFRYAQFNYWFQVLRSIGPIAIAAIGKLIKYYKGSSAS